MIEGEGENVLYCYIENTSDCKERHVSHSSPAVSRSIAGCFTQQNIGEVSHSDGGVEKTEGVRIQAKATIPDSAFIGRRRRKEDGGKRARTV